jgi:hypothetical protein
VAEECNEFQKQMLFRQDVGRRRWYFNGVPGMQLEDISYLHMFASPDRVEFGSYLLLLDQESSDDRGWGTRS